LLNYLPYAERFLRERFGDGTAELDELSPSDISGFILRYAKAQSPGRAKLMVTALRSLFRFLHMDGQVETDMAACVPTVANWRMTTVPKSLRPEEVEQLLESCDLTTATGQRNYAILLILARLGLRAGAVVAMTLDDINWESGELAVRTKGGRRHRLPIPQDVGEALAGYIRDVRPSCSTRKVFVRMKAPFRGFAGSVAVCSIVSRALDQAGLHPPCKGAHLLRHSLATRMLRNGGSLAEIGEVLGHRFPNTTEIYAKVDLTALRQIARPWPGGQI
jgi:integrase/recombinase XerD